MAPTQAAPVTEQITVHAPRPKPAESGFRTFLSELNPLQYLPVVGTIYRAITGDEIPETARTVGSLVVSGLTGGPAGIGLSIGAMAVEHWLGLDPERLGRQLLTGLGVGHEAASAGAPAPAIAPAAVPPRWSASAAYQVHGDHAADTLNGLELARLHAVA